MIDNTQTTLYPGGILNTGLRRRWAQERIHDAQAASPTGGQPWAYKRIQEGDQTCKANQALHPEAVDLMAKIRANDHYVPEVADPLSPVTFVNKIKVPTFMACQWTDEQTGGHCPTLAKRFTGTDRKWFTFTNGTHVDSLAPETFNRWYDFLQLYVAKTGADRELGADPRRRAGDLPGGDGDHGRDAAARPDPAAAHLRDGAGGVRAAAVDPRALRQRRRRPPARPPGPRLRALVAELPDPGHRPPAPGTWAPGGSLADAPPAPAGADSFTWNARNRPLTNFTGNTAAGEGGLWTATPPYQWSQNPAGSAASYVTAPLGANTTVIGGGAVKVWVRSSTPNVDLQATISEVRPDGKETFVQGGWLRGDMRKLDAAKSTPLEPVLSLRAADVSPLPADKFVEATIPLYYQGHAYRAGSRIRVTIAAPNGDQPIWSFGETRARAAPPTVVHRPLEGHALEAAPAGGAGDRPDRAAAVPGAPGRALPGLPAVREPLVRPLRGVSED